MSTLHKSSCALHNAPASLPRPCDCGEGMTAGDWWNVTRAWAGAMPAWGWAILAFVAGGLLL